MVYLNVQCCKYIWMVCSTYIFVWHKLKKKCLRVLAYLSFSLCCCLNLIKTISRSGAQYCGRHLSASHNHTHAPPSTPNHSRMAFTSAPCRALPLGGESCVAAFKLTLCPTDSQHCDLSFIMKTVDLATVPQSHNDQTQSTCETRSDWLFTLLMTVYQCIGWESSSLLWQSDGLSV